MAASVSHSRFPLPPFRQDAHWVKFKHTVASCDKAAAARFLDESYKYKPIEEKLDQLLLELNDQRRRNEIVSLPSAMKLAWSGWSAPSPAVAARPSMLGDSCSASIYLIQNYRLRNLAERHAAHFRTLGWEGRARFMDSIAAHKL